MFAHNVLFCQVVKQPAKKYSQAVKPIWLLICFQAGLLHISKIKFSSKPSCRIISEPVWCTDCPPNSYVYEVASTQSYDYLQPYKTQQQLSHTEMKIQGVQFRHFVYIVPKLCFFLSCHCLIEKGRSIIRSNVPKYLGVDENDFLFLRKLVALSRAPL